MVPKVEHDVANGGDRGGKCDVVESDGENEDVDVKGSEIEKYEVGNGVDCGSGTKGDCGEDLASPNESEDEQSEELVEEEVVEKREHAERDRSEDDDVEDVVGNEPVVRLSVSDSFFDEVGESEHAGLCFSQGVGSQSGRAENEKEGFDENVDLEQQRSFSKRSRSPHSFRLGIFAARQVISVSRSFDPDPSDVPKGGEERVGDDGVDSGRRTKSPRTAELPSTESSTYRWHRHLHSSTMREIDEALLAGIPVDCVGRWSLLGASLCRRNILRTSRDAYSNEICRRRGEVVVNKESCQLAGRRIDVTHVQREQKYDAADCYEATRRFENATSPDSECPTHEYCASGVHAKQNVL